MVRVLSSPMVMPSRFTTGVLTVVDLDAGTGWLPQYQVNPCRVRVLVTVAFIIRMPPFVTVPPEDRTLGKTIGGVTIGASMPCACVRAAKRPINTRHSTALYLLA